MNWKNSLLLVLVLFSSAVSANEARYYQTYQRLQAQLQKDPLATLQAVELFEKQVASADKSSQQMAAYLHVQACIALNRYQCAARSVERLLNLTEQADKKQQLARLSAQLHYQTQDYTTVIKRAGQWLSYKYEAKDKPKSADYAELYSLKAYSLYNREQFKSAASAMEQGVRYQATEQRYRFLLGCYQQLKNWRKVNSVLSKMVERYSGKSEYWEKYAYSFLKLDNDKKALAVLGSAYKAKRLPERSILLYSQLLLRHEAAIRAVKVLESHPELAKHDHYAPLLTQSYLLARDKQKAAQWLAKSNKKNSYTTRGLLAYQQGQWQQAIEMFSHLDAKKKSNHYWFLLVAISEFEMKRWPQARQAFKRLEGTQYKELAKQWLVQIDYLTQS
ncbi:tetratricopeptide repeat protein [Vibrio sp. LaRot3]|uniref:tetratricopeptide repeat protein n=1 Tax=Vibrio sp. LaRot3 TaxID=2998829 RepID=UPI0022CE2116|nr:hypothetical protein [Vibrio sp. LaRot3]MDA0149960.1 hypothetical protein [Vibrio sp. LaRot3]